jgi:hypothetical protein
MREVREMQDAELFLAVAEIAGVFVGFGALIAIRSAGAGDIFDVAAIQLVVLSGIIVVIVAFAPIVIGRFGVTHHWLWFACSVLFLLLFFGSDEVLKRVSPERRAWLAAVPLRARARLEIIALVVWGPMIIALVVILLGVLPDQEPALYLAAVALDLLMALLALLFVVVGKARPKTAASE